MDLFLLENGQYLLFGILGLGFLIAGIITGKMDKGVKKNKVYNAEILACDIVEYYLAGMPVQGFEITFGIQTNEGTTTKRLTRREPLDVGETIEVYYDSAKGIVKPVDEVETVEGVYPTALCVLGVIFLLVMCALAIFINVNMGEEVFPFVFGFAACGLFLYIGLYLAILRPHKLNKELINCELVEGEIIDVIKSEKPYFCSFRTFGGTEKNVNGVLVVEDTATIETWFTPEIKSDCNIEVDGQQYEILGTPENINKRNQYLVFKVHSAFRACMFCWEDSQADDYIDYIPLG